MIGLFVRLLVVLFALALAGCSGVAGTDDVELTYETTEDHVAARFGEDTRALALRRLTAAQIGADVSEEGRGVRVIVDERAAPVVDELLTWTGILSVVEIDPDVALAARETDPDLEPAKETWPDGREEHYWIGARADVIRAVETWSVDREHRVLAEPLWTRGAQELRWRTRVVRTSTARELGDGALVGWADGGALRIRAKDGSSSDATIREAAARKGRSVIARGRISLGVPTFASDAVQLTFGGGFEAYARAQKEMHLLATPRLPQLRRTGSVGLPPNTTLMTACFGVPVLLSLGWLFFVRRFDRAHPEPMWLILVTFGLGGVSALPAGYAELVITKLSPWLDPRLVTFGGQAFALPLSFLVFTAVVGTVEEGAKRLAAGFAVKRREFDEPVDGIVYGIVASLGFAAAENIRYFAVGRLAAPLVIARCFMSVPAHMFFGAIWGYALGARLVDTKKRTWVWLGLSAAAHGLFDALLSTEGAGTLAVILELVLASLFVVFVRRALRHGVVVPEMLAIRPEDRLLVRVGRPWLFWTSAICLHLFALGIFILGAWYQLARHRPSLTFVVGSSVLLVLLAIAALGVSRALPLDVAIDDYGVTFAGAARAWRKIRGFAVKGPHVELDCEAGPILLGPADAETQGALSEALSARIGAGKRIATLESH